MSAEGWRGQLPHLSRGRRPRRGHTRLVAFLALMLAACGTSPHTRFFAIDAVPATSPPRPVDGPPVRLAAVHLPAVLDRREMVRRGLGNSIEVSGTDRWAAALDRMSLQALGDDLAGRLHA